MSKHHVLVLNKISAHGLKRLPDDLYELSDAQDKPDAIMLRSFDMHSMDIPDSVQAVARAGAGTNNIPIQSLSERGVPVFNSPGANANAVKELVLTGMLMSARNIGPAMSFVENLQGDNNEMSKLTESGKKKFHKPESLALFLAPSNSSNWRGCHDQRSVFSFSSAANSSMMGTTLSVMCFNTPSMSG